MQKRSFFGYLSYAFIALIPFSIGIYVLLEKKMIVGGRLSPGEVHELAFPADIIMASSFFLFAFLILISTTNIKYKTRIAEICFMGSIILFGVSVFM